MRYVGSKTHGRAFQLTETELQQAGEARWHLDTINPAPIRPDQRGVGSVRRQGDRSSMRHRHGDAVHAHSHPYAEPLDQPDHGGSESLPLHVWLGAAKEEEDLAMAVRDSIDPQMKVG